MDKFKKSLRKIIFLMSIIGVVLLESCGIQYIDAPSVDASDRWKKNEMKKNEIFKYLKICGYNEATWDINQQEVIDKCMILNNFIFIDSPYGRQGSMCKYEDYNKLPSCQSLRIKK